jgi:hypothetical protein
VWAVFLGFIGACLVSGAARAQLIAPIDHYECYQVKEYKGVCQDDLTTKCRSAADCPQGVICTTKHASAGSLSWEDQFGVKPITDKKLKQLCTPAEKEQGPPIQDRELHYKEYQTAEKHVVGEWHLFSDQFGNHVTYVDKIASILVPTAKTLAPAAPPDSYPAPGDADHYVCYKAKHKKKHCTGFTAGSAEPPKCKSDADCEAVAAGTCDLGFPPNKPYMQQKQDQFGTWNPELKKVKYVCAPAVKNQELPGPVHPDWHLVGYQEKLKIDVGAKVHLLNQFGPESVLVRKPKWLYVPALKNPGPTPTTTTTSTTTTTTLSPLCPNGVLNPGEQCDPPQDAACPGLCKPDCTCGIEVDPFPNTGAIVDIVTPLGNETVFASGPTRVEVNFGTLADNDEDGLEEVQTEIVQMELSGISTLVGPVTLRLRDPNEDPFRRTTGEIEEGVNNNPGVLDLPPFVEGEEFFPAESFFDVFFEIEIPEAQTTLHNRDPKRMTATITHKPPGPGEVYQNPFVIQLLDAEGNPTEIFIELAVHVPNPTPPCGQPGADHPPECDGLCPPGMECTQDILGDPSKCKCEQTVPGASCGAWGPEMGCYGECPPQTPICRTLLDSQGQSVCRCAP